MKKTIMNDVVVKTDYVPDDCDYLSVGKEYSATHYRDRLYTLTDDQCDVILICINRCSHLNWKPWTVKED